MMRPIHGDQLRFVAHLGIVQKLSLTLPVKITCLLKFNDLINLYNLLDTIRNSPSFECSID